MYPNGCKVTSVSTNLDADIPVGRRPRNRRGEGSRLRQDILDAAGEILEETGSPDAVTLRAIARRVGIAAPSIYAHFPDPEAVLVQLLIDGFVRLTATVEEAMDPLSDPVERLLAGCRAYLRQAASRPQLYRILFDHADDTPEAGTAGALSLAQGLRAFEVLVGAISDCARAGRSVSTDPFADATAVWVVLHGLAILPVSNPGFPWPPLDQLLTTTVTRIARIDASTSVNQE
jgi:AcrR family transcriptional regulator